MKNSMIRKLLTTVVAACMLLSLLPGIARTRLPGT